MAQVLSVVREGVLTVGSLFSGIDGLGLGLEWAGMRVIWQSEIEPYACAVLEKHRPDVPNLGDIRAVEAFPYADVLCGGFPCQPVSHAGLGLVQSDERWLWPEFARAIRLVRPRYVLVENVAALLFRGMGDVLRDLAAEGFDAEWSVLRASDFGAPHERERVYILAYPHQGDGQAGLGDQPDGQRPIFTEGHRQRLPVWLQAPHRTPRVADGVPDRFYRPRGEAIGNAVVPQIAEWLGRQIVAYHTAAVGAATRS